MRKLNKRQKKYIETVAKLTKDLRRGTIFSELDIEDIEVLEDIHTYETLYQDANRYFVDCMLAGK